VTGATGFLGSHIIKLLLEREVHVIGTVRDITKKEKYEQLYAFIP